MALGIKDLFELIVSDPLRMLKDVKIIIFGRPERDQSERTDDCAKCLSLQKRLERTERDLSDAKEQSQLLHKIAMEVIGRSQDSQIAAGQHYAKYARQDNTSMDSELKTPGRLPTACLFLSFSRPH